MGTSERVGAFLDRLNELYDFARFQAGQRVEAVWTKLRSELQRINKQRKRISLQAEIDRKKPKYEAKLPPDTSLSFFHDYEIIDGCPVFTLDAVGSRTHSIPSFMQSEIQQILEEGHAEPSNAPRLSNAQRLKSFKIERLKISCYAFSHNDRYVVCGMTDGSVTVWDADNGTLRKTLKGPHEFRIADVAFLERSSATLVSVDLDGVCVKWFLNTHPVRYTRTHCSPTWDDASYVGKELAVPRLSTDGRYLGFPVYTYVQAASGDEGQAASGDEGQAAPRSPVSTETQIPSLYSIVYVFETSTRTNERSGKADPMLMLPVQIQEAWVVAERLVDLIRFSRTSKCLLLTVYELAQGYVVLWPHLEQGSVASYCLQGTRGRFSQEDKFLVTWHGMLTSDDQLSDERCYVWDLDDLGTELVSEERSAWNHPYYRPKSPMIFEDPNEGNIICCDFVRLKDQLGLMSCCAAESVKVVIWSLRDHTPVHVLLTGILRNEISPDVVRAMTDDVNQIDRLYGTECVAVSRNGQWVGVYASTRRTGIVWNVSEGVEIMRLDISSHPATSSSGMDFCFSRKATRLLSVGRSQMLLWSPSVLRRFNPADRPMYELKSADTDLHIGQSICKFSGDGSTVGAMRFNADCLTIWRLQSGQRYVLDRSQVTQEVASADVRQQAASYFRLEQAKNRFCQFVISKDGRRVVTCMGDMSVLFWNMENLHSCRRIATLSSYYCPALDICFSKDPDQHPMVVVCQDQGSLIWIDLLSDAAMYREETGSTRSCRFSANGSTAVLMTNPHHVRVWDLVHRRQIQTLNYKIPILSAPGSGFYPQLSPLGDYCLVGFSSDGSPLLATEATKMEELSVPWYPESCVLSADGRWVLVSGPVDEKNDDLLLEQGRQPCFASASMELPTSSELPLIDFREDPTYVRGLPAVVPKSPRKKQTWKIIDVRGEYPSKQMRLPKDVCPSKCVILSPDGSKCAALDCNSRVVVWGTHFTYNSLIQQRKALTDGVRYPSREQLYAKLNDYGPALVNHPYERGMTLLMECVATKRVRMLKHLVEWSQESGVKLSFQGRMMSDSSEQQEEEGVSNVIDLAVDIRSPEIVEILLQAMVDGVTPDMTVAQIMERSLVKLSYKYPTLMVHLFRSRKFKKSLGVVNISEDYLRKRNDYFGVVTDRRLVASQKYVQALWNQTEDHTMKNLADKLHVCCIPAEAEVVPYPNVAKMGSDGILQPLLFERVQHFIFGSDVIKGVINYKFETYGRHLLLEDLFHYLLLLVVFTLSCWYTGFEREFGKSTGSRMTMALVSIIGLGNFVRLLKQGHTLWKERGFAGLSYYLADYMRWIELLSYLVVVFMIPIAAYARSSDSKSVIGFMAIASVLLWVKMLYYAQAFKSTGPMVVMLREIVKDVRWFLFLLVALLVGFGTAFFVLLKDMDSNQSISDLPPDVAAVADLLQQHDSEKSSFYFAHPVSALFTSFMLMLSDISDILGEVYNADNVEREIKILAFIMFFIFLAIVAIVLLNLLIAIMGDSFDRVKNHEKTLFLQRRAEVIQDMEMGLSENRKREINERIERYLHILVPNFQSSLEESDWEGRLVDIQRRMREELKDARERGTSDLIQLKRDVKELKRLVSNIRSGPLSVPSSPLIPPSLCSGL